jgi:hypothetical protein
MNNAPVALIVMIGFIGCMDPTIRDAIRATDQKSYLREFEADNLKFEIRFVPRIRAVLERCDFDSATGLTPARLDSLKAHSFGATGLMFLLTIGPKVNGTGNGMDLSKDLIYSNTGGYEDFRLAINAFLFGLKDKIWMECNGLRIPLSGYQMENNYGLAPHRTFMLFFPKLSCGEVDERRLEIVMDDVVPGLARKKIQWTLPLGKYDELI